jgi:pimeloyl-ACP methyl ester carboxylesterase
MTAILMVRFSLPFTALQHSPLAGGPTEIHYRQFGSGRPLVFLHGGWGYEIYPLSQAQISIPGVQVIIPDRSGYGRSGKPAIFSADFHHLAAAETLAFLDALNIRQCMLWGHSDGAVIAALIGLMAPPGLILNGLILEALHYYRVKPRSQEFFEALAANPDGLGERIIAILAHDHGEQYWRNAVQGDCRAWIEIARSTVPPDLYGGRMSQMRAPVALVHGESDPRTEPGELEQVRRELPAAQVHIIAGAEHCPHSERDSQEECARVVRKIVGGWSGERILQNTKSRGH